MQEGDADGAGGGLPGLVRKLLAVSSSPLAKSLGVDGLWGGAGAASRPCLPLVFLCVREWKDGSSGAAAGAGICGVCAG